MSTWLPSWDGASYAANTAHHRAFDDAFLASTPLTPADRVLDIGCGSGDLTAAIAGIVNDGHVVGLDAQPSMLDEARRRARINQSFVQLPVQQLDEFIVEPFDVIVSRAVLHWVPAAEQPDVWRSMAAHVRAGGWVRVECGGAGNTPKVLRLLDDVSAKHGGPSTPWTFLDAAHALDLVERAGLDVGGGFVRTVAQRRPFDDASLRGWLTSQALQAYTADLPLDAHASFEAEVDARLHELRRSDGTLDQTFVRLDVLARRPEYNG